MSAFRSCALLVMTLSMLLPAVAEAGRVKQKTAMVQIAGQSLDDGVGELPHYAHWADPSGKTRINIPGETLDSGLGAFVEQLEREFNEPLQVGTATKPTPRRK